MAELLVGVAWCLAFGAYLMARARAVKAERFGQWAAQERDREKAWTVRLDGAE